MELGISTRQLRRLQTAYQQSGSLALNSKRIGRPSNNRLPERVRQQVVFLMKHRYEGVGPMVGHRHLTREHGLKLSVESLRKIMIAEGLWQHKPRQAVERDPSVVTQPAASSETASLSRATFTGQVVAVPSERQGAAGAARSVVLRQQSDERAVAAG